MEWEHDIQSCIDVLRNNGIILFPSEEGWVLAADATCNEATALVFDAAKETKEFSVLVAEEQDILRYVAAPDLALFNYLEQQEQPVTVLYEGVIGLSEHIPERDGAVPIRIVNEPFARALVKRLGKPLVAIPVARSFSETGAAFTRVAGYTTNYGRNNEVAVKIPVIIKWGS